MPKSALQSNLSYIVSLKDSHIGRLCFLNLIFNNKKQCNAWPWVHNFFFWSLKLEKKEHYSLCNFGCLTH